MLRVAVIGVLLAGVCAFGPAAVVTRSSGARRNALRGLCPPAPRQRAICGTRCLRADLAVTLSSPLGIVFEEVEPGEPKGLIVADLVPGGNAERDGKILVGDKLVSTSAVVLDNSNQPLISLGASGGATNNWRREMIPCGNLDFNTIMSAIKSNSGRYGYRDVRLIVRRTDKSIPRSTETIVRKPQEPEDLDLPLKVRPDPWQQ